MKQPRLKRIKIDANGTHWPQYKVLFFWLTYRNNRNKKERFGDMWGVKQFLRAKHNQDLMTIKRIADKGIVEWDPTK